MAYFLRDVVMYVALLVALVLVSNLFAVAALEVVMALVVSGLFVVGHDAAHGALFKSKRMNSTVAHLSFLPSWHVYEGWILGHNRVHHPYTLRQGYDFVWQPSTPEQFAALGWWRKAVHWAEWFEHTAH
jgi:omega-6 fatty acid desaturase (delta-12 desaturase)